MQIIKGTFNEAKVFTDKIDDECRLQIQELLNLEPFRKAKVRIMPDCHVGASCVIGFTADLGDKIIPNVVGVDIGCGMLTVGLGKVDIDFERLDKVIREYIPSGRGLQKGRLVRFDLQRLTCFRSLKDTKGIQRALGTLGGGNHFIEIDADEAGNKYLIIHTGSRQLGKQVCEHYQKMAVGIHTGKESMWEEEERIKREYKAEGRRAEIQEALKELHRNFRQIAPDLPLEFCFLHGKYSQQYLNDMSICQEFADVNRKIIASLILEHYGVKAKKEFTTVHNYIDHDTYTVRKGAVSARKGELLLIPINMRDGSLLCVGKGNEDWNYSAPHGAGRCYSCRDAKRLFTVEEYENTMREAGVFSTSVNYSTLTECPMAYKEMADIAENISETAEIIRVLKPIYNFKANSTTIKST